MEVANLNREWKRSSGITVYLPSLRCLTRTPRVEVVPRTSVTLGTEPLEIRGVKVSVSHPGDAVGRLAEAQAETAETVAAMEEAMAAMMAMVTVAAMVGPGGEAPLDGGLGKTTSRLARTAAPETC